MVEIIKDIKEKSKVNVNKIEKNKIWNMKMK
jgi:hypothetical protein